VNLENFPEKFPVSREFGRDGKVAMQGFAQFESWKYPGVASWLWSETGFRYFAKPDFSETDKFSLTVVGKNLREEGYSTVEITVSRRDTPLKLSAASP
jgi:hypothetical protein